MLCIKTLFLLFLFALSIGTLSPAFSFAQQKDAIFSPGEKYSGFIPECASSYGDCSLCQIVDYVIDIMAWMVRFVGIAVFIMVLYGGGTLLISQGKSEQTEKGKTIIKNSIIGLCIVLFAWTCVNVIIGALAGQGKEALGGSISSLFSDKREWNVCAQ